MFCVAKMGWLVRKERSIIEGKRQKKIYSFRAACRSFNSSYINPLHYTLISTENAYHKTVSATLIICYIVCNLRFFSVFIRHVYSIIKQFKNIRNQDHTHEKAEIKSQFYKLKYRKDSNIFKCAGIQTLIHFKWKL